MQFTAEPAPEPAKSPQRAFVLPDRRILRIRRWRGHAPSRVAAQPRRGGRASAQQSRWWESESGRRLDRLLTRAKQAGLATKSA